MIWRDDDVLQAGSGIDDLLHVDNLLRRAGCVHTVAILAETLTPALAAVIRDCGMVPQLHGWSHDDLSVDEHAIAQLPAAVEKLTAVCGRPTVLFPPWNRTSPRLEAAAAALGLRVSAEKVSLEQVIRFQGKLPDTAIVNFHYWHAPDRRALAEALRYVAHGAAA